MLDITAALRELPDTSEIHIVSVDNECKEILLILTRNADLNKKIKTINISKNKQNQVFEFSLDAETDCKTNYTSNIGTYLYEPNAAVMKSGSFKLVGSRFELSKLHSNTHLYTSCKLKVEFPGRIFKVEKVLDFSKQELKEFALKNPKANISVRNFPQSVEDLRKKLKIKDGGEIYLFACTLADRRKVIIECKKV